MLLLPSFRVFRFSLQVRTVEICSQQSEVRQQPDNLEKTHANILTSEADAFVFIWYLFYILELYMSSVYTSLQTYLQFLPDPKLFSLLLIRVYTYEYMFTYMNM